jgi:hypothetical protein
VSPTGSGPHLSGPQIPSLGTRNASSSQMSGPQSGSHGFTSGSHSINTLGMQAAASQQQARSPSHSSASVHQRQLNEGLGGRGSMDIRSSKDMPTVPSRLSREHQALLSASDPSLPPAQ